MSPQRHIWMRCRNSPQTAALYLSPRWASPTTKSWTYWDAALVMVYAPRLEPFGLAPLEANACGLPVVAVAEGGVRETIIDQVNGLLVDCNPAAMGATIQRLRDDPALARQLGAAGRKLVEANWGVEQATDRLERQLKSFRKNALTHLRRNHAQSAWPDMASKSSQEQCPFRHPPAQHPASNP